MRTAEDGWLLPAWEMGSLAPPVARGAVLAHVMGVTATLDDALDLPLDALAVALARNYAEQFADNAAGTLACPGCGEVLDVEVPVALVATAGASDESVVTTPGGQTVRLRVPSTRDVLAATDDIDVAAALLARAIVADEEPVDDGGERALSAADRAALESALDSMAGAAAVSVRADCPLCATTVSAPVDIADFVWERIAQRAPALLADVATLAAHFGWAQDAILSLTPLRRDAYLALVRGVPA